MATTHTLPRDVNSDKPSIHMSDSFKDVPPTDLAGDVDPEKAGLDGHAVAFDGKGHALVHLDKEAERKLTWKIDVRIVPIVTACYICCFIDRSNIGNARLAGLERDLGMTGNMYNAALAYFTYILAEIPSQVFCKWMGPGKWIPILTVAFGLVSLCTAFVSTYGGLIAIRLFLGLTEAGMLPGIAYFLSRWYKRDELVFRLALYIVSSPLAGAFGGLLASGILSTGNIGRIRAWQKIFFVEGVITFGIGIIAYFLLTDRPETARWLTEDEKLLCAARVKSESVGTTQVVEKLHKKTFYIGLFSINSWLLGLIFLLDNISVQGISVFAPTIINGLYPTDSLVTKQLKTVPPYVVGAFFSLVFPLLSMRMKKRGVVMMMCAPLMVIGWVLLLAGNKVNIRYSGVFFVTSGAFPFGALTQGWASANASPDAARASAIGVVVFCGNLGGLISTFTFLSQYAPRFTIGTGLNVATSATIFGVAGITWLYQKNENRTRAAGKRDHRLDGLSPEEISLLGSRHPQYIYTY